MQTLQLYRSDVSPPRPPLLPGAMCLCEGEHTRLWIGTQAGNLLLISTDPKEQVLLGQLERLKEEVSAVRGEMEHLAPRAWVASTLSDRDETWGDTLRLVDRDTKGANQRATEGLQALGETVARLTARMEKEVPDIRKQALRTDAAIVQLRDHSAAIERRHAQLDEMEQQLNDRLRKLDEGVHEQLRKLADMLAAVSDTQRVLKQGIEQQQQKIEELNARSQSTSDGLADLAAMERRAERDRRTTVEVSRTAYGGSASPTRRPNARAGDPTTGRATQSS